MRKDRGVLASDVFQDALDPSVVVVAHRFPDMASASAFAHSRALREAMSRAGVVDQPDFWFLNDVEPVPN
ncbi:MAG: cyclase [Thermus sp.]